MDGKLIRLDALLAASSCKEFLGKLSAFAMGDHPAHSVAAEDIEHHVKVEVSPLGWPEQLSDVLTCSPKTAQNRIRF